MERIVIAVDGPAGAGKGTISKIVAKKLNIEYIDTGAMYRAVTLKFIRNHTSLDNLYEVNAILADTDIYFINGRVYLDDKDVSEDIRMPYVTSMVSEVSAMPAVRNKLVELQRIMAGKKNVIMEGRDIGTNVLKDAGIKIYLTATVEQRAKRRYQELLEKGTKTTFDEVYRKIEERDRYDMSREINPLIRAKDAVIVDTTSKDIDEVVMEILQIVNRGGE